MFSKNYKIKLYNWQKMVDFDPSKNFKELKNISRELTNTINPETKVEIIH